MSEQLIEALLASPEPSLRWKVRTRVLGEADRLKDRLGRMAMGHPGKWPMACRRAR